MPRTQAAVRVAGLTAIIFLQLVLNPRAGRMSFQGTESAGSRNTINASQGSCGKRWAACTKSKCCEGNLQCCGHHGGKWYAGCQDKCWPSQEVVSGQGGDSNGDGTSGRNQGSGRKQSSGKNPQSQGTAPQPQVKAPQSQGTAPQPQGTTPQPQGTAPQSQGTTPQPQGTPPQSQGTPPQSQGTTPQPQGTAPQSQGTTPQPQGTTPQSQGTPPQGGGGWKKGPGKLTHHIGNYDKDKFNPIDQGNWNTLSCADKLRPKQDQISKYSGGFGHPVGGAQGCGECAELRVKKKDGTYNTAMGMTVDLGGPEITSSVKKELSAGVDCGGGRDCVTDDPIPFEWRPVEC